MAAATQAAIGNRKRCALMIITIMTAATAILTRNQPPPMCAIAKAMKGFLMFTWLKGWFQRKSNGNMFELISWFIMILLLIDRDYIWLFIWENGNIPAGEFWDVMGTAPLTVMLSVWGAYIIVAKVFRTGIPMLITALVMVALLCNWIMTYAVIYRYVGLIDENGAGNKDGLTCLYFSIVTWTTLGYGDVRPSVAARMIAASEALIGYLWMAMFIGVMAAWFRQMFTKMNQPAEPVDNSTID